MAHQPGKDENDEDVVRPFSELEEALLNKDADTARKILSDISRNLKRETFEDDLAEEDHDRSSSPLPKKKKQDNMLVL